MPDLSLEDKYLITVGLEVHCELRTATKLFCGCANAFGSPPNTNVCPVCLGLPGSLPVLNRQAVEYAIAIGLSLNCDIRRSVFARKNYFYPDMPKDFQISQYDEPICVEGFLALPVAGKRVGIVRAHIEEDTGKTTHVGSSGRIHGSDFSLVDYNRSGIPLVEIVSEPDMESAEEAREYVSELRAILVATGATDGKMEEGSMRVDANVSVRLKGTDELGTRCEIKNLNSLRSLGRAIQYEAQRQMELVEEGGRVHQETRHWNEDDGLTSSLRSKEEANDYRYFPEPDLVPLEPSLEMVESVRRSLPVLPPARRAVLAELAGGRPSRSELEQIGTCITLELDGYVISAAAAGVPFKLALSRTANELAALVGTAEALAAESFVEVLKAEDSGRLSATQAKAVMSRLAEKGGSVEEAISALGFVGLSDSEVAALVERVTGENPDEWGRYLAGENQLAGFFIGAAMKASGGKVNGRIFSALLAGKREVAQH